MSCGATVLARRALEEALAAGARPRRVAQRGVESLTPASCASPSAPPRGTATGRSLKTCS